MHWLPCRSYLPTWGLSSHGSLATSWYVILFLFVCVYTVTFHHLLFYFHALNLFIMLLFIICAFTSCVFSFVICFVFSCDRWLDQSVLRSKSTALCFNSYFILFYHMLLVFLCISHLHLFILSYVLCTFFAYFVSRYLYALFFFLCVPFAIRFAWFAYCIWLLSYAFAQLLHFSFLHFICCILLLHMVLLGFTHFLMHFSCI